MFCITHFKVSFSLLHSLKIILKTCFSFFKTFCWNHPRPNNSWRWREETKWWIQTTTKKKNFRVQLSYQKLFLTKYKLKMLGPKINQISVHQIQKWWNYFSKHLLLYYLKFRFLLQFFYEHNLLNIVDWNRLKIKDFKTFAKVFFMGFPIVT